MKEVGNKPYRCEKCKQFFRYKDRKVFERKLYNITTKENACPYCGSWNISLYTFNNGIENKYLSYDVTRDKRYYNK